MLRGGILTNFSWNLTPHSWVSNMVGIPGIEPGRASPAVCLGAQSNDEGG